MHLSAPTAPSSKYTAGAITADKVIITDGVEAITMDGAIVTVGEIIIEGAALVWRLLFCDNSLIHGPDVALSDMVHRRTTSVANGEHRTWMDLRVARPSRD